MARLTCVYRAEDISYVTIGRRQLPVVAGENLMMLMDLNHKGLAIDSPQIRGRELEEFTRKFNLLSSEELRQSLEIDSSDFLSVLNQCVQCVGCRRSVERLFYQLTLSGHPTLDPLVLKNSCALTISDEKMRNPQALGSILYRHNEVLNNLLENKLRNKTRCLLHSLDFASLRTKPFSETWRDLWSSMKQNCKDELAVIDTKELQDVLENYLKKHKFCQGCRTKIEKAYNILIGEKTTKEKGFVAALYANIKKCQLDKHIHVITKKMDFMDAIMRRAESEVNGSFTKQRERHAKTLEIAQEEVLTCVGMIMYERLRRVYVSLREEEKACQVLAAVGVHALFRSFDLAVEKKQGMSNLELLYKEMSRAERAKELKREQKKLKKKKKKIEKKMHCGGINQLDDNEEEIDSVSETAAAVGDADVVDADAEDDTLGVDDLPIDDQLEDDTEVQETALALNDNNNVDASAASTQPVALTAEIQKKKTTKTKQKKLQAPKKKNKKKKSKSKVALKSSQAATSDSLSREATPTINQKLIVEKRCVDCFETATDCPCENDVCAKSLDAGYGTDPHSLVNSRTASEVSSEGSEVSCSESCCNHERISIHNDPDHDLYQFNGFYGSDQRLEEIYAHAEHLDDMTDNMFCTEKLQCLTLEEMLIELENCIKNDDYYIPKEVVMEYQCHQEEVERRRQQLRTILQQEFNIVCQKLINKCQ